MNKHEQLLFKSVVSPIIGKFEYALENIFNKQGEIFIKNDIKKSPKLLFTQNFINILEHNKISQFIDNDFQNTIYSKINSEIEVLHKEYRSNYNLLSNKGLNFIGNIIKLNNNLPLENISSTDTLDNYTKLINNSINLLKTINNNYLDFNENLNSFLKNADIIHTRILITQDLKDAKKKGIRI